jgi:cytochrome c-type biogenesis protein CcmH/NrfG
MQGRALVGAGKRAEARAVLEKSVAAGPYQLPSWVMLGIIARDDGRMADAASAFEQALLRSPMDRWLLRQLDAVYAKMGDASKRDALAKVIATTAGTSTGTSPSVKGLPAEMR